MRKLPPILLILAFFGLGTGSIEYLHNLDQHDGESHHDQSDCPTHAVLRGPLVLTSVTPQLHTIGEVHSLITFVAPSLISQHAPARIDCRGPPTC